MISKSSLEAIISSLDNVTMSFKTAPITAGTPTPNPIHGTVTGSSGDDVIVYAMKDKSVYPVSAYTKWRQLDYRSLCI